MGTEDIKLPQPVTDDDGQVIVADAGSQVVEDKIVLPMTEDELMENKTKKVNTSARWLAEWCVRLVKKWGDKVAYREGVNK